MKAIYIYKYNPQTKQNRFVIKIGNKSDIWSDDAVLNNKLYFVSDSKVHEIDPIANYKKQL